MSMSGLSPETEDVLRRALESERMPMAQRRRLKGAVLARIALASTATLAAGHATATGLASTGAASTGAAASTGLASAGLVGGLAAKTVVGIALIGSLGAGSYLALRPARPPATPAARVAPAPRAPAPRVEPAPVAVPEPVAPVARHRPVARRAPAPPASDLAVETQLLRDADRALRAGNTARALSLLDDHAARFPKGALAPERTAERLIVTCELGVADSRRVDSYLASHPAAPLAARVRRACAPK
jgi:hypothetical protein